MGVIVTSHVTAATLQRLWWEHFDLSLPGVDRLHGHRMCVWRTTLGHPSLCSHMNTYCHECHKPQNSEDCVYCLLELELSRRIVIIKSQVSGHLCDHPLFAHEAQGAIQASQLLLLSQKNNKCFINWPMVGPVCNRCGMSCSPSPVQPYETAWTVILDAVCLLFSCVISIR